MKYGLQYNTDAGNAGGGQQQTAEPQPGSPEYDIKMAGIWAHANKDKLPPEFGGDPDKFIKSFKDTKAELTRKAQELADLKKSAAPGSPNPGQPKPDGTKIDQGVLPQIPETTDSGATGLDWAAMQREVGKDGKLSDASLAAIKAKGIPDEVIQQAVNGWKAQVASLKSSMEAEVGGAENLQRLVTHLAGKLTPEQKATLNKDLSGPNGIFILKGLWEKHKAEIPGSSIAPSDGGERGLPANEDIQPFADQRELTAWFRDPRYRVDPEYRALCAKRAQATSQPQNRTVRSS